MVGEMYELERNLSPYYVGEHRVRSPVVHFVEGTQVIVGEGLSSGQ